MVSFIGRDTVGICVNGRRYRVVDVLTNVFWGEILREYLVYEIIRLFVIKSEIVEEVRIPLLVESLEGYEAGLSSDFVYEVEQSVVFKHEEKQLIVSITEGTVGKWITMFKT